MGRQQRKQRQIRHHLLSESIPIYQWDELPYEIWLEILQHLPMDNVVRISRTCKLFLDVCRDEDIWKRIHQNEFRCSYPFQSFRATQSLLRRRERVCIHPVKTSSMRGDSSTICGDVYRDVFSVQHKSTNSGAKCQFCMDIHTMTPLYEVLGGNEIRVHDAQQFYIRRRRTIRLVHSQSGDLAQFSIPRFVHHWGIDSTGRRFFWRRPEVVTVFSLSETEKPMMQRIPPNEAVDLSADGHVYMANVVAKHTQLREIYLDRTSVFQCAFRNDHKRGYGDLNGMQCLPSGRVLLSQQFGAALIDFRARDLVALDWFCCGENLSLSPFEYICSISSGFDTVFWDVRKIKKPVHTFHNRKGQYVGSAGFWVDHSLTKYDAI